MIEDSVGTAGTGCEEGFIGHCIEKLYLCSAIGGVYIEIWDIAFTCVIDQCGESGQSICELCVYSGEIVVMGLTDGVLHLQDVA